MQSLANQRQAQQPRRRFSDLKEIAPAAARGLSDHWALRDGRTIFPSRVFDPGEVDRVLISGVNHRKLGDRVTKGPWRGMPIFALTLEEGATCPASCHHWRTCYGNGMQYARRLSAGDALEDALDRELAALQGRYPGGFVVRLHILGDFYSGPYVYRWGEWLARYPALHVFGYTAWRPETKIGGMVQTTISDRFMVRVSHTEAGPMRAATLWEVPEKQPLDGIICPAQTGKTDCCGSCGLCWSLAAQDKTIYFLAHGARIQGEPAGDHQVSAVSIKEFFAAAGSRFTKADATVIGPQLQEIAKEGKASAAAILDVAKSTNSPLHRYFEWDDKRAAHQYRLGQADDMARSIRLRLVSGEEGPATEVARIRVVSQEPPPRIPMQRQIGLLNDKSDAAAERSREALFQLTTWAADHRKYLLTWKRFSFVFDPVFAAIKLAENRAQDVAADPRIADRQEATATIVAPSPVPAPLKIGESPPVARRSLVADLVDEPNPVMPAAWRAARALAEKEGKPMRIVNGEFRIGEKVYTAAEILAHASAA